MNVFYEEEGTLKVGAVLADNTASLQVEAPHGKRSKIKSANVLLRFEQPGIADPNGQLAFLRTLLSETGAACWPPDPPSEGACVVN